jgi:hypothetical protein
MGKLPAGPFGPLIGLTGNNVGKKIGNKNIFTIKPHPSSKDSSAAQLHGQSKFAVLSAFLSNLAALIDRGFGAQLKDMTPMNAAISQKSNRYGFRRINDPVCKTLLQQGN